MTTIYKIIGGGQQVRENQEYSLPTEYIVCEMDKFLEASMLSGCNSYADTMWSTNLERLQEFANEWAGREIELVEKTILN